MSIRRIKISNEEKEELLKALREQMPPGTVVHTIVEVARQRYSLIRPFTVQVDKRPALKGEIYFNHLWYEAAALCGLEADTDYIGVRIYGTGLCRQYEVVHELGRAIYPDGFGDEGVRFGKKKRPKTRKEAEKMKEQGYAFYGRNGNPSGWDNDGGYAFVHRVF